VRRLVGTMVASAIGQIDRGSMARWLKEPTREPASLTAPPSGLFLESVEYSTVGDERAVTVGPARGAQFHGRRGHPPRSRR